MDSESVLISLQTCLSRLILSMLRTNEPQGARVLPYRPLPTQMTVFPCPRPCQRPPTHGEQGGQITGAWKAYQFIEHVIAAAMAIHIHNTRPPPTYNTLRRAQYAATIAQTRFHQAPHKPHPTATLNVYLKIPRAIGINATERSNCEMT